MKTKKETLENLIRFASSTEQVSAVILNGSRVNSIQTYMYNSKPALIARRYKLNFSKKK